MYLFSNFKFMNTQNTINQSSYSKEIDDNALVEAMDSKKFMVFAGLSFSLANIENFTSQDMETIKTIANLWIVSPGKITPEQLSVAIGMDEVGLRLTPVVSKLMMLINRAKSFKQTQDVKSKTQNSINKIV